MLQAVVGFDLSLKDCDHVDAFDRWLFTGSKPQMAQPDLDFPATPEACEQQAMALASRLGVPASNVLWLTAGFTKDNAGFPKTLNLPSLAEAWLTISESTDDCIILSALHTTEGSGQQPNTFALDDGFERFESRAGFCSIALMKPGNSHSMGITPFASLSGMGIGDQAVTVAHSDLPYERVGLIDLVAADEEKSFNTLKGTYGGGCKKGLGSMKSLMGNSGNLTGLLALIKLVIAVNQRYFPATADWQGREDKGAQDFFINTQGYPWYRGGDLPRVAALHLADDVPCHILISEPDHAIRPNGFLAGSNHTLILLSANSIAELNNKLTGLETEASDLKTLAKQSHDVFDSTQSCLLALLADSREALLKEIQLARSGIPEALQNEGDWKTPNGSYFTATPSPEGICFMYPGIGASYIGLGQSLLRLFPTLWPVMESKAYDLGKSLQADWLNPKTLKPLSFRENKALEYDLRMKLADIAEGGVAFACLYTAIFRDVLGITPDFGIGYSMGEISLFAALDVWQTPSELSVRLPASHAFTERLSGKLLALNDAWGDGHEGWETYSIRATKEQVAAVSDDLPRVYCTIINTADNVIIGGEPSQCLTVAERLKVRAMPLDMANAIHSPPAEKDYAAIAELFDLSVGEKLPTKIYSTSCYLPVPQFTRAIAHSLAKCLCDPVDFPRLVQSVYEAGARVFIETGPGRSLSSWVNKVLEGETHAALPANAKGVSDELTLLRAIAKLAANGVAMDLSCLYSGSLQTAMS